MFLEQHDSVRQNHIPVLLKEVLNFLNPAQKGIYVDCTFGNGGYTKAILDANLLNKVISFDIDKSTEEVANLLKAEYGDRFHFINANFDTLEKALEKLNISKIDGIVADLGVSSMQLDSDSRGFSFLHDSFLDMRMGASGRTAFDIINFTEEEILADIIFHYGQDRFARKIAKEIVLARQTKPIKNTFELADIVRKAIPIRLNFRIDPATKTFQAIRIYLNDELANLERLLSQVHFLLRSGGRLGVISFHELEDRIVKNYIKSHSNKKIQTSKYHNSHKEYCLEDYYDCRTHKLYKPSENEIKNNRRARSARLRTVIRL